jgi:hypothetical protein
MVWNDDRTRRIEMNWKRNMFFPEEIIQKKMRFPKYWKQRKLCLDFLQSGKQLIKFKYKTSGALYLQHTKRMQQKWHIFSAELELNNNLVWDQFTCFLKVQFDSQPYSTEGSARITHAHRSFACFGWLFCWKFGFWVNCCL